MPEIPDIEAYIEALRPRVVGETLLGVRLASPFLLRTVDPPLATVVRGCVEGVSRLGKRIVLQVAPERTEASMPGLVAPAQAGAGAPPFDAAVPGAVTHPTVAYDPTTHDPVAYDPAAVAALFLVIHLMIAGRLHWKERGAAIPKGSGIAAFDFTSGTLVLTEAGSKRRASLHLVRGRDALVALDPGGIDLSASDAATLATVLRRKNQTLKRALTDPSVISGVGNAYSDEILHRARLSPFKHTRSLDDAEIQRLRGAGAEVLAEWTNRLRSEAGESFPGKVTAFRPEMAVHGRFGAPCPVCGARIERIVYADNECNYCPSCQTGGRVLADRALSRLLKDEWPANVRHHRDQEV